MSVDEGMKRLMFHAQPEEGSFLHMLRPYRGLRQEVLNDVLNALRASAPMLFNEVLQRELMSALWAISHLGRSWALPPDGMLGRNQLISETDREALGQFIEQFDYAVMTLLDGGSVDEAFSGEITRGC
jgi:hypothetical protein